MTIASQGAKVHSFEKFIWTDFTHPNEQELNQIASQYGLDYFQIRDSLEHGHLPKFERQPHYDFLILRAFSSKLEKGATSVGELSNKIAFFYNNEKLISIHRKNFDFLQNVPDHFQNTEDLLLYLIHKMLETYKAPLNTLDQKIEVFEKIIFLKDYSKVSMEDLYYLKTQTRITKKLLNVFQQAVNQLVVSAQNATALQDIKDSLFGLLLNYDEVLESAGNLLHSYHSVNSQKSNDVMKLLTIFSAFFLPLTFILGIYGMNFEFIPELSWKWGYPIILAVMMLTCLLIYSWFKRKRIL